MSASFLSDGYVDLAPGKIAGVVTYLEMRSPPARRLPAGRSRFRLRPVASPSLTWYRDLFKAIGGPWLWYSRLQLTDDQLSAILTDPREDVFALEDDGRDKGLLELDRRHPTDIELAFIGVTPDLIGQGAGQFLMNCALDLVWSHRPQRVFLHTCTLDHPDAVAFYVKNGFVPYKRAVEVANDPRLTGALPMTAAPHIPIIA